MTRRNPGSFASAAIILALVVPLVALPCAASESEGEPALILARSQLDNDEIKPGDDDQPTIKGRRRGPVTTVGAPGDAPESGYEREDDSPTVTPFEVLRTWLDAVRGFIERRDTLR
jgi:hypothetical protein